MGKISTRNQLAESFKSTRSGRIGFRVWIGWFWVFWFTDFWPISSQIYESWARFLWIYENLAKLESGLPEFWLSLSKSGLVCQNLAYLSKEEARPWPDLSWSEWSKPKRGQIRAEKRQIIAGSRWFSSFFELLSGGLGGLIPWGWNPPLDPSESVLMVWDPSLTRRRC